MVAMPYMMCRHLPFQFCVQYCYIHLRVDLFLQQHKDLQHAADMETGRALASQLEAQIGMLSSDRRQWELEVGRYTCPLSSVCITSRKITWLTL